MNLLSNKVYVNDIQAALDNYDFKDLDGKTVFVSGSTGLICSALIDVLIMLKHYHIHMNIIAAGRDSLKIRERFSDAVIPFQYDALQSMCLPDCVDYIIHGAGTASPELYTTMPVETMLSNITGVKNLLEYCKGKHTKMVYLSSSEVYGKLDSRLPIQEETFGYIDLNSIRTSYVEAKRASEMLCRSYASEYDVDIIILRPGHIFGPTASINDKRISSDFAYKAANGIQLELLSPGLQRRSYCYCIDAACSILVALVNGISGEAYNVGSEEITSIREMAELLAKAGRVSLQAKEPTLDELNAFNPMDNSALSIDKICRIGFKPSITTATALEHTVTILKEVLR